MKKWTKLVCSGAFALALVLGGVGLGMMNAPEAVHADETETVVGHVIDFTAEDGPRGIFQAPMEDGGEGGPGIENTELGQKYLYSYAGNIALNGTRLSLETAGTYVKFKLKFDPENTSFIVLGFLAHVGNAAASVSPDNTAWTRLNSDTSFDWYESVDVLEYMSEAGDLYVRLERFDDQGEKKPLFNRFVVSTNYKYTPTLKAPTVGEKTEQTFKVCTDEENTYLAGLAMCAPGSGISGSDDAKFRFFDGNPANGFGDASAKDSDFMGSQAGYYAFEYGEDTDGLKLKMTLNSLCYVGVRAGLLPEGQLFEDKDVKRTNGNIVVDDVTSVLYKMSEWTTIFVNKVAGPKEVTFDLTDFMKDNESRFIYIKIADGAPTMGNGGQLFGMTLVERTAAEAPTVTGKDTTAKVGDKVDLSTLFTVKTEDKQATYTYKVDGTAIEAEDKADTDKADAEKKFTFTPSEEKEYSVELTVTDRNGNSATATAKLNASSGTTPGGTTPGGTTPGGDKDPETPGGTTPGGDKDPETPGGTTPGTEEPAEDSGCGSIVGIGAGVGGLIVLLGTAIVFRKKKD